MFLTVPNSRHRSRSRFRFAALGAFVVVLGGVACNAASSFTAQGAAPVATSAPAAAQARSADSLGKASVASNGAAAVAAQAAPAAQPAASPGTDTSVADTSAQILNRMIIRNAQLTLEVPDVE